MYVELDIKRKPSILVKYDIQPDLTELFHFIYTIIETNILENCESATIDCEQNGRGKLS